jgi:hypothetical protein
MLAGVTANVAAAADDATKMDNEDLFFEKVKALNKIPIGASETEVIRAVGERLDKTHLHDGSRFFCTGCGFTRVPELSAPCPSRCI